MAAENISLSCDEVLSILPHQPPFVFIDTVEELVPGEKAVGVKYLDHADPVFRCHFPGNPIYPGVYLIEGAGQTAFVMFCYRTDDGKVASCSKSGYLGRVKSMTFRSLVGPGASLRYCVELIARFGDAAKVGVKIFSGDTLAADGEMYFTVAERGGHG